MPFPEYLKKYQGDDYAKVGTLFEPDYEAVNAAEPDLIIVGGRSAAKYAALKKIAPTVDLTVDARNFIADTEANIEKLARFSARKRKPRLRPKSSTRNLPHCTKRPQAKAPAFLSSLPVAKSVPTAPARVSASCMTASV